MWTVNPASRFGPPCISHRSENPTSAQLTLYRAKAITVPHEVGTLAVNVVACHIWYREEEETGQDRSPPRPIIAVPNVTAHPLTASVPITLLLYNGPLLCGFNVPLKG